MGFQWCVWDTVGIPGILSLGPSSLPKGHENFGTMCGTQWESEGLCLRDGKDMGRS